MSKASWASRMSRGALLLSAGALAASGWVTAADATTAPAQSGADAVEACEPATAVPEAGRRACKSVESGSWLAAQYCRRVPDARQELCPTIDGREIHEEAMADFEAGWLARALDLQRGLDLDVPLWEALIPHTHNSANSAAYDPTLSNMDANQVLSVPDQLRLGFRGIEIDVHWTPNPSGDPADGFKTVVQCHGAPVATPVDTVHAGCSVDRTLEDHLVELRTWLEDPANDGEFVLLYLENALDDDPRAHAEAVAVIDGVLGELVFRPEEGGGCQQLPVGTESKRSLLDAGGRVLITGNCGPGGWNDRVFARGAAWDERGDTTDYECGPDRHGTDYGSTFVRRYEDSTWLSTMTGGGSHIRTDVLADMVRCGVNLPGLDQARPDDPRLQALVWSWRDGEPAVGTARKCAAQGEDARFFADDCAVPRRVACRTADGDWAVTGDAVEWARAHVACEAAGHTGAGVPENGWHNHVLRSTAADSGAGAVWLAYAQDDTGTWVAGARAPSHRGTPDERGRSDQAPGHGDRPDEAGPPAASRGESGGQSSSARHTWSSSLVTASTILGSWLSP